ncbi:sigma factor-like helix-turn-helix DNA-binding protein [Selenomonas sp. F0473]|uniref:sigma factor-like helix-turn-helix DNA-binding protein n=1 Tax=Selenomonas sp. F0473 TaxID=999423 RepID=UPI0025D04429|nr:sigma factor-like helix-turn-helix DNA-binding protein [Selenomonas sp. F0473]
MSGAKEYLRRIKHLDMNIGQKIKERDALRAASMRVGGGSYDQDRVTGGKKAGAKYTSLIDRLVDIEREIEREIDSFARERHETINRIQRLPQEHYADILYRRYVEYKSLTAIAKELGYSYDHIRRLHGRALYEFGKYMRA